jgi:aurora kinase A-interacting protein
VVLPKISWCSLFPSQIKFERDLKRIWLKAGLKEAPEGWQTPKIYGKNK